MRVLDSAPTEACIQGYVLNTFQRFQKKIKENITILDQSKKLFVLPVPLFFLFPGVRQFQRNATKAFGSKNL